MPVIFTPPNIHRIRELNREDRKAFRRRFVFNVFLLLAVAALILILFIGCNGSTDPVVNNPAGVSVVELDSIWVFESERMVRVSIQVRPFEPADTTMLCQINSGEGAGSHFRLYDDGNYGRWQDSEGFADSLSGDIAPNDGIFSRRINSNFAARPGEYHLSFILERGAPPDTLYKDIIVRENSPPVFLLHTEPDSVASGSIIDTFHTQTLDSDGFGDIQNSELILFRDDFPTQDISIFEMERTTDSTWRWISEPFLAAGAATGVYSMAYRIQDYYLSQLDEFVYSDTFACRLENLPPQILEVTGPDTVWLPESEEDTITFDYSIQAVDDQTPKDLDTLYLEMYFEDEVIFRAAYLDGFGLDETPNDGVFKAGFSLTGANTPFRTFYLVWTPSDKAGNTGDDFDNYLTIWKHEGTFLHEQSFSSDFGKSDDKQAYDSPFR